VWYFFINYINRGDFCDNESLWCILIQRIKKTYLKKLVEQHFSKTLFNASESAKNTFFVTSPKLKIFDKKCLTLS
jgi:hypothetical protein